MVETKWYVGTTGVKLVVQTNEDLTNAVTTSIIVRKPDGTIVEWGGVPNDTKIEYVIQEGDLDQAGVYRVQAKAIMVDGSVWFGETDTLVIYELFE
ncbi:MAG: hypothetical protein H0Z33_16620 [Bacillaceae bacterium]|nr:hypothetical protein [Bacillaceae bacterium]